MHVNYRYLLENVRSLSSEEAPRCLDYGCGAGDVVLHGRASGIDFYGVEAFYAGSDIKGIVAKRGLLDVAVKELQNGKIPFPDDYFDVVVSNQVFEHIEDLQASLAEIHRVLRVGGKLLALFPSKETLREGHCGIPLVHWLPKGPRFRYPYLLGLRRLGLGHHKEDKTPQVWARDFSEWLDAFVYYRTRSEIMAIVHGHFARVHTIEDDYVGYRLRDRKLEGLARVVSVRGLRSLSKLACRLFGSMVLVAEKTEPTS